MAIREHSDTGTPVVVSEPDSLHAKHFRDVALKVATRLFPEEDED